MIYRKAVVAVVLVSLAVPLAFGQEWPKEQIPTPRIRNEIKAHESGLAVWWTGHNGWLIRSDALLIGTDLATEDQGRLYQSPITAAELAPMLDLAFITHKHGDHFNRKTARVLADKGTCIFIMRFWASGYPNEVKLRLSKPLQERFHILGHGEKLTIRRP